MNTLARPAKAPRAALLLGATLQPWIPGERQSDGTPVVKIHDQRVVRDADAQSRRGLIMAVQYQRGGALQIQQSGDADGSPSRSMMRISFHACRYRWIKERPNISGFT